MGFEWLTRTIGDIGNGIHKTVGNINNGINNATRWLGHHGKEILKTTNDVAKTIKDVAEVAELFEVPGAKLIGKGAGYVADRSDEMMKNYYGDPNNNVLLNNHPLKASNRTLKENFKYVQDGFNSGYKIVKKKDKDKLQR